MYSSENSFVSSYEKTKKSNKNELAAIKYNGKWKGITVKDAYNYLEPTIGPAQAVSLLFKKYILL